MSSDEFIEDDDNLSSDSECSQAVEESLEAPKSDEKVDIKPATVRQTVDSVKLKLTDDDPCSALQRLQQRSQERHPAHPQKDLALGNTIF